MITVATVTRRGGSGLDGVLERVLALISRVAEPLVVHADQSHGDRGRRGNRRRIPGRRAPTLVYDRAHGGGRRVARRGGRRLAQGPQGAHPAGDPRRRPRAAPTTPASSRSRCARSPRRSASCRPRSTGTSTRSSRWAWPWSTRASSSLRELLRDVRTRAPAVRGPASTSRWRCWSRTCATTRRTTRSSPASAAAGPVRVRDAIRHEIELITRELATDVARLPGTDAFSTARPAPARRPHRVVRASPPPSDWSTTRAREDRILADTRTQLRMLLVGRSTGARGAESSWQHRVMGLATDLELPPPAGQRRPAPGAGLRVEPARRLGLLPHPATPRHGGRPRLARSPERPPAARGAPGPRPHHDRSQVGPAPHQPPDLHPRGRRPGAAGHQLRAAVHAGVGAQPRGRPARDGHLPRAHAARGRPAGDRRRAGRA